MLCGILSVAQTFPKRKRFVVWRWGVAGWKKQKGAAGAAPFGV